ncbi:MAG: acetolactate synthase small subunit [Acidobacteria bacterium]|nr:acetolactate synthase small subunit [Acidobacteriota bacterium]
MNTNPAEVRHHILSVLVENKPGVLARVSGLFARRAFNIYSLAVAPTNDPSVSRISIVVDVESAPLEQITKQLDKLINVLVIEELAPADAVQRELMIATVEVPAHAHASFRDSLDTFAAKVLDESAGSFIVSLEDTPERLDVFAALLGSHHLVAIERTGRVALPRLG